jgi:hypothetical protein
MNRLGKSMKYKVGDTFEDHVGIGGRTVIFKVVGDAYYLRYPNGTLGHLPWSEEDLDRRTLVDLEAEHHEAEVGELGWRCTGGDLERLEAANEDEKALQRISRMLILTNLAHRLGIPEPGSVDMSWDSLEYIEWVLWRCDGRIP